MYWSMFNFLVGPSTRAGTGRGRIGRGYCGRGCGCCGAGALRAVGRSAPGITHTRASLAFTTQKAVIDTDAGGATMLNCCCSLVSITVPRRDLRRVLGVRWQWASQKPQEHN